MQNKTPGKLLEMRGDRTRKEVSHAVGISESSLQMYECGQRTPRDKTKRALADYYDTSITYLFYPEEYDEWNQTTRNGRKACRTEQAS